MKIEISYKNSLIGSLSAGESLALHLNGSKLTEDLIVRAVSKLSAPTLSISGDIISITNNNDVGVGYWVYVNGELAVTITATNSTAVDMSGLDLEAGTYSVYLVAVLDGYENSEPSNAVEYVVEEETLAGKTYYVKSGWVAESGYGIFTLNYLLTASNYTDKSLTDFRIGYEATIAKDKNISCYRGTSYIINMGDYYDFTIKFIDGEDIANPKLIEWLETYGVLQ